MKCQILHSLIIIVIIGRSYNVGYFVVVVVVRGSLTCYQVDINCTGESSNYKWLGRLEITAPIVNNIVHELVTVNILRTELEEKIANKRNPGNRFTFNILQILNRYLFNVCNSLCRIASLFYIELLMESQKEKKASTFDLLDKCINHIWLS